MLGPIEVLVIGFPGNEFTGGILPELEKLVEAEIITVVDALFITKDDNGEVDFVEFDQIDENEDVFALGQFVGDTLDLLSDEDAEAFADALEPGSSAAALVFEHTWFKPLRNELFDSGGVLIADMRIPGLVVEAVMAEVEALEAE
jgi:Family of unknown function (DUF6325)